MKVRRAMSRSFLVPPRNSILTLALSLRLPHSRAARAEGPVDPHQVGQQRGDRILLRDEEEPQQHPAQARIHEGERKFVRTILALVFPAAAFTHLHLPAHPASRAVRPDRPATRPLHRGQDGQGTRRSQGREVKAGNGVVEDGGGADEGERNWARCCRASGGTGDPCFTYPF
jgi:hypothetical protein